MGAGLARIVVLGLVTLAIAGCTVARTPHFYPANAAAASTGVLEGRLVGHGNLHGTIEVTMPGGETLNGEYSIVAGGSMSFGNIFGSVYRRGGIASAGATSTGLAIDANGEGQASLYGSRGTSMRCEFRNNNMTGHGYGACRSSAGAVYRMEY